jgi:hypothetical protein
MTDIDLDGKSEHDLLIIVVTTLNNMTETLRTYCKVVDQHELKLAVLQSEHNERKNQTECKSPISKKTVWTTGGISGFIGAVLATMITFLIEYFNRK